MITSQPRNSPAPTIEPPVAPPVPITNPPEVDPVGPITPEREVEEVKPRLPPMPAEPSPDPGKTTSPSRPVPGECPIRLGFGNVLVLHDPLKQFYLPNPSK